MKDTLLYERLPILRGTRAYDYNPHIAFDGDKYLFDAISSVGQDVADVLKERKKTSEVDQYNTAIVDHAHAKGMIDDEEYNKFQKASHSQQTATAAALAASIAMDWKQKEFGLQQQNEALNRAMQLKIATMRNEPSPMSGQTYYHPESGEAAGTYTPSGDVRFFPNKGGGQPGDPVLDNEGKQIGVWDATGHISKTTQPKTDPLKEAIAEMVKGGDKSQTQPSTDRFSWLRAPANSEISFRRGFPEKTAPAAAAPAPAGAPPPASTGEPPKVTTQEDFDALPSGTVFVAPDGSVRRKP